MMSQSDPSSRSTQAMASIVTGLLEAFPWPVALLSAAGRILQANRAWGTVVPLPGLGADLRMPSPVWDVPPPFLEGLQAVLAGELPLFEASCPGPLPPRTRLRVSALPGGQALLSRLEDSAALALEETRRFLSEAPWHARGEDFFAALAGFLADQLAVDHVRIDRLSEDRLEATTLAVWSGGRLEADITYSLPDTPCGRAEGRHVCIFPEGARHRFPNDPVLQAMEAEGYAGVTLWGSLGQPIGLIAVVGRKPLGNAAWAETLLGLVAERAACELERRDLEASGRLSEAQLALSFSASPIGMVLADLRGRFLRLNPAFCAMVGRPAADLLGMDFRAITHPDDVASDSANVQDLLDRKRSAFQTEKRYLRKDGSLVWGQVVVALVRDVQGAPLHFLAQIQDITARRHAERQRQLTVEVLDILNRTPHPEDAAGAILRAIQAALDVEAAAIRLAADGDFHYIAHEGFPDTFIQSESCLRAHDRLGRPLFEGDGSPLFECICGLVLTDRTDPNNPLFTPAGSAWTNDARPIVEVRAGEMPRVHPRNRCIECGYRSIAIVPIRVEGRMAGALQLNDKRPGRFTPDLIAFLEGLSTSIGLALSRRQMREALEASERRYRLLASGAAEGEGREEGSGSILVVDDDAMILVSTEAMLELLGHDARLAEGGAAALDLLEGGLVPALVLLDMNMPGLSGAETLKRIREKAAALPVVIVTGCRDAAVERLLSEHPGVGCIGKPYSLEELRQTLEATLRPSS